MNNKGFTGIGIMIVLIVFGAIWVTGLAGLLNDVGSLAASNTEGLEALFYSNLNFVVGFFYLLAWVVVLKIG